MADTLNMPQVCPLPLTLKQEHFARAYVANGGNASAAYREAYDTHTTNETTVNRTAYDLVHNPKIAARVQKLMNEAFDAKGYSPEYVLEGIRDQIDTATEHRQHSPAMRGWELLGKWRRMFDADVTVSVDNSQHLTVLRDMGDAELRELLCRLDADTPQITDADTGTAIGADTGPGP